MANILVVDNQKWIVDICSKALAGTEHNISTTDDVESVMQNVLVTFKSVGTGRFQPEKFGF